MRVCQEHGAPVHENTQGNLSCAEGCATMRGFLVVDRDRIVAQVKLGGRGPGKNQRQRNSNPGTAIWTDDRVPAAPKIRGRDPEGFAVGPPIVKYVGFDERDEGVSYGRF